MTWPRKVIIDCDPGIDDAVALCLALSDPRLEVLAVTSTAGAVSTEQATVNIQAVLQRLDPPRHPRIGAGSTGDPAHSPESRQLHGDDGLGNVEISVSRLQHLPAAEKLIGDEVRAAPQQVTIVCLGPLTNVARAFQRDPSLPNLVGRVIVVGGSVNYGGNATAAAESHMYWDPEAARQVFRASAPKTVVPLDVTRHLTLSLGALGELPDETTRAGALLRRMLGFYYRAHHRLLGRECIQLHDVAGVLAVLQPELFQTTDMSGDVEVRGELTLGATIFDRRHPPAARPNLEVVHELDADAAVDALLRGLRQAARYG